MSTDLSGVVSTQNVLTANNFKVWKARYYTFVIHTWCERSHHPI